MNDCEGEETDEISKENPKEDIERILNDDKEEAKLKHTEIEEQTENDIAKRQLETEINRLHWNSLKERAKLNGIEDFKDMTTKELKMRILQNEFCSDNKKIMSIDIKENGNIACQTNSGSLGEDKDEKDEQEVETGVIGNAVQESTNNHGNFSLNNDQENKTEIEDIVQTISTIDDMDTTKTNITEDINSSDGGIALLKADDSRDGENLIQEEEPQKA